MFHCRTTSASTAPCTSRRTRLDHATFPIGHQHSLRARIARDGYGHNDAELFFFFFFFTLVTGPRRSLSLKLSDTRVYEPHIRRWLPRSLASPPSSPPRKLMRETPFLSSAKFDLPHPAAFRHKTPPERLVFYYRTTSASTAPCTPRRTPDTTARRFPSTTSTHYRHTLS